MTPKEIKELKAELEEMYEVRDRQVEKRKELEADIIAYQKDRMEQKKRIAELASVLQETLDTMHEYLMARIHLCSVEEKARKCLQNLSGKSCDM